MATKRHYREKPRLKLLNVYLLSSEKVKHKQRSNAALELYSLQYCASLFKHSSWLIKKGPVCAAIT